MVRFFQNENNREVTPVWIALHKLQHQPSQQRRNVFKHLRCELAQIKNRNVVQSRSVGVTPDSVIPGVRDAVGALDKEQSVNNVKTMSEIVSQTYGAIRFPMTLVWIFATLALVLSAVGIFGVMSYTVSRRAQEMAIRMALGAGRSEVLRLILMEALQVTAFGVVIGLVAAAALGHVMSDYIFGIASTDPITLAGASFLLIGVALFASYLPAWRATKVDPIQALRYE